MLFFSCFFFFNVFMPIMFSIPHGFRYKNWILIEMGPNWKYILKKVINHDKKKLFVNEIFKKIQPN